MKSSRCKISVFLFFGGEGGGGGYNGDYSIFGVYIRVPLFICLYPRYHSSIYPVSICILELNLRKEGTP